MPAELPTLLSRALIALTIEFDNEFEHRMPHRTARGPQARSGHGPWLVSLAMWANFLRFVDAGGVTLTEVHDLARLVNLGGVQRWGCVTVDDGLVRLTRAGQGRGGCGPPGRRGRVAVGRPVRRRPRDRPERRPDRGGRASRPLLPWYLPVASVYRVEPADQLLARPRPEIAPDLPARLARVLLAFAHDFEQPTLWARCRTTRWCRTGADTPTEADVDAAVAYARPPGGGPL